MNFHDNFFRIIKIMIIKSMIIKRARERTDTDCIYNSPYGAKLKANTRLSSYFVYGWKISSHLDEKFTAFDVGEERDGVVHSHPPCSVSGRHEGRGPPRATARHGQVDHQVKMMVGQVVGNRLVVVPRTAVGDASVQVLHIVVRKLDRANLWNEKIITWIYRWETGGTLNDYWFTGKICETRNDYIFTKAICETKNDHWFTEERSVKQKITDFSDLWNEELLLIHREICGTRNHYWFTERSVKRIMITDLQSDIWNEEWLLNDCGRTYS